MYAHSITKMVIVVAALVQLAGCSEVLSGERVGLITGLQRSGRVSCRGWEGEMAPSVPASGVGVLGNVLRFAVEDMNLAQQVQKAMETKKEVKITYTQNSSGWCRIDADGYFLTKIEPLLVATAPVASPSKEAKAITPPKQPDITQELLRQNSELLSLQRATLAELRQQRESAERAHTFVLHAKPTLVEKSVRPRARNRCYE